MGGPDLLSLQTLPLVGAREPVAEGAAVQAAIMEGNALGALRELLLLDVTSHAYGIGYGDEPSGGREKIIAIVLPSTTIPNKHSVTFQLSSTSTDPNEWPTCTTISVRVNHCACPPFEVARVT
jgi:molecular chaperone DnaK (HSP70)